jgi:hypothetical protein
MRTRQYDPVRSRPMQGDVRLRGLCFTKPARAPHTSGQEETQLVAALGRFLSTTVAISYFSASTRVC